MTPAEELRAAATRLRELTTCASVGPWFHDVKRDRVWQEHEYYPDGRTLAADVDYDNALWIAAMSPAVAEPVAVLMEAFAPLAEHVEAHGTLGGDLSGYSAAIQLARLILGVKP